MLRPGDQSQNVKSKALAQESRIVVVQKLTALRVMHQFFAHTFRDNKINETNHKESRLTTSF